MWEFRQGNFLWRIPADSYEQAVSLLCRILFVQSLPSNVRFIATPEEVTADMTDRGKGF